MPTEKYTIVLTDAMCELIFQGLVLLKESKRFDDWPRVRELNKTILEQFRNLSNRKVPEVTEVHMINPESIDVIKREKTSN